MVEYIGELVSPSVANMREAKLYNRYPLSLREGRVRGEEGEKGREREAPTRGGRGLPRACL